MSDLGDALRCDDCGKFTSGEGATFASMFDFVAMCPDYDHCRCGACTERLGPVKSNARPHSGDTSPYEWSGDRKSFTVPTHFPSQFDPRFNFMKAAA